MSVLYLYYVTVQYFPILDKKSPYFIRIGWLGASVLYHCFSTIKAVDRKKYPNEKTRDRVGSSNMTFQAVYSPKYIPVLYSKTSNNL